MNAHHPIVDLNNTTVELLNQQDFEAAIRTASAAMVALKPLLQLNKRTNASNVDSIDSCVLLSTGNGVRSKATQSFIYGCGIPIPPTVTDDRVMGAILIFNSAMAHHLHAARFQDSSSPCNMQKARRLYTFAYRLRDLSRDILFDLAIMNNVAVIELELGNLSTSTAYFELVESRLMIMVDRGCAPLLHQIRGFLWNLHRKIHTAPAA